MSSRYRDETEADRREKSSSGTGWTRRRAEQIAGRFRVIALWWRACRGPGRWRGTVRHKNRVRACSYDRHVMGVVRSKNSLGDVRDRRDDADGHWIEAGRDEMCVMKQDCKSTVS